MKAFLFVVIWFIPWALGILIATRTKTNDIAHYIDVFLKVSLFIAVIVMWSWFIWNFIFA